MVSEVLKSIYEDRYGKMEDTTNVTNDTQRCLKIKLKDEVVFRRFDGLCNEVNFENPIYLICNHRYENGSCYTLAMIPHSRVEIIEWEEDDE